MKIMTKRVVGSLLIVMLICTVLMPFGVAEKRVASGSFYGMSWQVTDGVLLLGEENTPQMVWFDLAMHYDDWPWDKIRDEIVEVRCVGPVIVSGSIGGLIESCKYVKTIDLSAMDVSGVVDMTGVFAGCQSLMNINIDGWNTEQVTSMERMFRYCSNALSFDLSMLNTARVTNMYEMFYMCENLTGLNLAGWDISSVENMERMFMGCTKLTEFHFNEWSASNVVRLMTEYDADVPKWLINTRLSPTP